MQGKHSLAFLFLFAALIATAAGTSCQSHSQCGSEGYCAFIPTVTSTLTETATSTYTHTASTPVATVTSVAPGYTSTITVTTTETVTVPGSTTTKYVSPSTSTSWQPTTSTSWQPTTSTSWQPTTSTSWQPTTSTSWQPTTSTSWQPTTSTSQPPQPTTSQPPQPTTSTSWQPTTTTTWQPTTTSWQPTTTSWQLTTISYVKRNVDGGVSLHTGETPTVTSSVTKTVSTATSTTTTPATQTVTYISTPLPTYETVTKTATVTLLNPDVTVTVTGSAPPVTTMMTTTAYRKRGVLTDYTTFSTPTYTTNSVQSGICMPKKNNGATCGADVECKSAVCKTGTCAAVPAISGVTDMNTDGTGTVTIFGTNFGTDAGTVSVQYIYKNDVVRTCTVQLAFGSYLVLNNCEKGYGGNYDLALTVHEYMVYSTISYAKPTVTSVLSEDVSPFPCAGGSVVTFVGANFGGDNGDSVETVTVGGVACTSFSFTGLFTELRCVLPAGIGADARVVITHGYTDHFVEGNTTINFAERELVDDSAEVIESPTTGGINVTYTFTCVAAAGSFFARVDRQVTSNPIVTGDKVTFKLPSGTGLNKKLFVSLNGDKKFQQTLKTVNYESPVITNVEPQLVGNAQLRAATASGQITIYGTGFAWDAFTPVTITIGTKSCSNPVILIPNVKITCFANGVGLNWPISITIDGQSNNLATNAIRVDFAVADVNSPCDPHSGSVSTDADFTQCTCWSGFAPEYDSNGVRVGDGCPVRAVCPGQSLGGFSTIKAIVNRPTSSFHDDRVTIKQTMPITAGVRDVSIRFATPVLNPQNVAAGQLSPSTCNYPTGNLWRKTVSELDCLDEFHGELPWSQHDFCNWVEDTAAHYATEGKRVFKTNLVTTIIAYEKDHRGATKLRTYQFAYLLSVSFKKEITIVTTLNPINVVLNELTVVDVTIVGDAVYDVASRDVVLQMATTTVWPYTITDAVLAGYFISANTQPTGSIVSVTVTEADASGDLTCDSTQDSECEQLWDVRIDTTSGTEPVCNLAGKIDFVTGAVECRDSGVTANCAFSNGSPSVNFTIKIDNTQLCEVDATDASKDIKYEIQTFEDAALTAPMTLFQVGATLHWALTVTDSSTIDKVTVTQVRVYNQDGDDDLLYTDDGTTVTYDSPESLFNLTKVAAYQVAPGQVSLTSGQFKLIRLLDSVGIISGSNSLATLTIEIDFNIYYHGNSVSKRSMTIGSKTGEVPARESQHISLYFTEQDLATENTNEVAVEQENDMFQWFESSATMTAASFAALAVTAAAVLAM